MRFAKDVLRSITSCISSINKNTNLEEHPGRVLLVTVGFVLAMRTLDFELFDWIYWLIGIESTR
jgi:hypothetical protein